MVLIQMHHTLTFYLSTIQGVISNMKTVLHIKSSTDGNARPKRFFSTCSQQRKADGFRALHCHLLQILKYCVHGLRQDGYDRYLACHHHRRSVHRISSKIKRRLLLLGYIQQAAKYRYHQQVRWWIQILRDRGMQVHRQDFTTDELPSHTHVASISSGGEHIHYISRNIDITDVHVGEYGPSNDTVSNYDGAQPFKTSSAGNHTHTVTVNNTGGNTSFNEMQPYDVVFRWKRTAQSVRFHLITVSYGIRFSCFTLPPVQPMEIVCQ